MKTSDINALHLSKANFWLSQHGKLSHANVSFLAKGESLESMEALRSLADDNNILYSDDTPREELMQRILSAMDQDPNDGVE